MAKKGGLGRGFDSLFAENSVNTALGETMRITEIEPNRNQPRKNFDETTLQELSESIKTHGLLQPLVVRPTLSGTYQLVAGERRWRASRMAGLTEVPVIIKDLTDQEAMAIAMIENLQREDLNPVEEAMGYKYLIDKFGATQEDVAEKCGKNRATVANAIRLLKLDGYILEYIKQGKISAGHGRAILAIESNEVKNTAVKLALEGASVRDIERLSHTSKKAKSAKKPEKKDNFYKEAELALKEATGRTVKIATTGKNKGTVTLEFYSKEDLTALVNKLSIK